MFTISLLIQIPWAVDEVIFHERPRSPRQRSEKIKERPQTTPESTEQPAPTTSTERATDRPPPKGPTAKTEYTSPPPEGTIISHQKQAEVGALPRETTFRTAPKGTRPPRTKPADIHSPESKIVPRQKQTAGIGTLPKGTPARTVQEGGRLPRIRPAAIHDQEHKVSPHQNYTVSPRQNAASPSRTNPVQRDGAIQPLQVRPPEQLDAPNTTTAISLQKTAQIKERSASKIKEKGEQAAVSSIKQRSASPSESIVSIESIHPPEQRTVLPKERPIIRSSASTPNQRIGGQTSYPKASATKSPPQRTPAIRQPGTKMQSSTPSDTLSMPPMQKDVNSQQAPKNLRRKRGVLGQQKKITPQQTFRDTAVPNIGKGQKLSKT